MFKPIITLTFTETVRGKRKRPDIDAIYHHISKSEATKADRDFDASALHELEN